MQKAAQPACFPIADISGYTNYLMGVELEHANDILTDLMGAVVSTLRPNFKLAKLEGDAAFMSMAAERVDGTMLLDTIERCYLGFRRRCRDVRQATSCPCNACVRVPDLDLKFVVHFGRAIEQKVYGRRELVGPDVIVVHRLLKNSVVERLGLGAYALLTQACVDVAALDPAALDMTQIVEAFEGVGDVPAWAHDLEHRWLVEEARSRVMVEPEGSVVNITFPAPVPPQVAWEFLTAPGQRMSWQPWVTQVEIKDAAGGRRGPGSSNHCMHGKDAVVEEILDWRPYDYITDRTVLATPHGPVKLLHTIEFEPDTDGTIIHMRYGPPKSKRELALMPGIGPPYEAALRSALPSLLEQLADAFAARVPAAQDPQVPTLP